MGFDVCFGAIHACPGVFDIREEVQLKFFESELVEGVWLRVSVSHLYGR